MSFGDPSNSAVGKPASLPKAPVPKGDAVPPAARDGINSVKAG